MAHRPSVNAALPRGQCTRDMESFTHVRSCHVNQLQLLPVIYISSKSYAVCTISIARRKFLLQVLLNSAPARAPPSRVSFIRNRPHQTVVSYRRILLQYNKTFYCGIDRFRARRNAVFWQRTATLPHCCTTSSPSKPGIVPHNPLVAQPTRREFKSRARFEAGDKATEQP